MYEPQNHRMALYCSQVTPSFFSKQVLVRARAGWARVMLQQWGSVHSSGPSQRVSGSVSTPLRYVSTL